MAPGTAVVNRSSQSSAAALLRPLYSSAALASKSLSALVDADAVLEVSVAAAAFTVGATQPEQSRHYEEEALALRGTLLSTEFGAHHPSMSLF